MEAYSVPRPRLPDGSYIHWWAYKTIKNIKIIWDRIGKLRMQRQFELETVGRGRKVWNRFADSYQCKTNLETFNEANKGWDISGDCYGWQLKQRQRPHQLWESLGQCSLREISKQFAMKVLWARTQVRSCTTQLGTYLYTTSIYTTC